MAVDLDFCKRVRHVLLGADTYGISFRDLNARSRTPEHPTADLRTVVNAWRRRKWVDQFEVIMPSGQVSQRWRATQLLLEQWPMVEGAIVALLLAPGLPLDQDAFQTGNDHQEPSSLEPVAAE